MYNETTVPPSIEVTEQPYQIVNNPDNTVVQVPIDVTTPTAQTSCGLQILSGMDVISF
jgi:hypothetical protein